MTFWMVFAGLIIAAIGFYLYDKRRGD